MPRKKSYQREVLVARAAAVFHRRGYQAASTEILVHELGVNRNSVYSEFGSKEALFTASLDHYAGEALDRLFDPLEAPGATLSQIENLFRDFRASAKDAEGLGCLLCNTTVEWAAVASDVQQKVEVYLVRMRRALRHALRGAIRDRQVAADLSLDAEAGFLQSCCLGIFVLVRGGAVTAAQAAADGALSHLRALRATRAETVS